MGKALEEIEKALSSYEPEIDAYPDDYFALIGMYQAYHYLYRCRFSCPVWTQVTKKFTFFDCEGKILYRCFCAISFCNILKNNHIFIHFLHL